MLRWPLRAEIYWVLAVQVRGNAKNQLGKLLEFIYPFSASQQSSQIKDLYLPTPLSIDTVVSCLHNQLSAFRGLSEKRQRHLLLFIRNIRRNLFTRSSSRILVLSGWTNIKHQTQDSLNRKQILILNDDNSRSRLVRDTVLFLYNSERSSLPSEVCVAKENYDSCAGSGSRASSSFPA